MIITSLLQAYDQTGYNDASAICDIKYREVAISSNGDKYWYLNGQLHKVEGANGDKRWYQNGQFHRENGRPAIEYANGNKRWYQNGILKYWFQNGQYWQNGNPINELEIKK